MEQYNVTGMSCAAVNIRNLLNVICLRERKSSRQDAEEVSFFAY